MTEEQGFYTSKGFLPKITKASKPGMCSCKSALPDFHNKVRILNSYGSLYVRLIFEF